MGTAWRYVGRRPIVRQGILVAPEVAEALAAGSPVVALESALITHGFAPPANLAVTERMMASVRSQGAIPAVCTVLAGEARVGLSSDELSWLASCRQAIKISLRGLPAAGSLGQTGGTTVAASIHLARRAGISVFATGGIGGVHRGHPEDVSADLPALATTPLVVVCSGAKSILDLRRTLEHLETRAVPVIGFRTDEFPAFYSQHSGLPADVRVESPSDVARMARVRNELGLEAALLVCSPVPDGAAIPFEEAEAFIAQATAEAEAAGMSGSDLTPFLLRRTAELSKGRTELANVALLESNARIAAQIACAIAELDPVPEA